MHTGEECDMIKSEMVYPSVPFLPRFLTVWFPAIGSVFYSRQMGIGLYVGVLLYRTVGRIAIHDVIILPEQLRRNRAVVFICGCDFQRMEISHPRFYMYS